jgi:hypothetical protein
MPKKWVFLDIHSEKHELNWDNFNLAVLAERAPRARANDVRRWRDDGGHCVLRMYGAPLVVLSLEGGEVAKAEDIFWLGQRAA